MFSRQVLARFHDPRFTGKLENATHEGIAGIPGDGPYMHLWLRINAGIVRGATFETFPCPAAIACGSLIAELSLEKEVATLSALTPRDLILMLGGLPEGKEHCAELAVTALKSAVGDS